jgi:hypothetical protein
MNRKEKIELINQVEMKLFQEEVSHLVHGVDDREYDYDELDALFDIEERSEHGSLAHRGLLKQCRQLLTQMGFYRAMPQDEIDNTWVSGGTKWHFKMGGVPYTSDYNASTWVEA